MEERLPSRSQQTTVRGLGDVRVRNLVERLITPSSGERSRSSSPFSPTMRSSRCRPTPGGAAVGRHRRLVADARGVTAASALRADLGERQPAMGAYRLDASGAYVPIAVDVLTLAEDRVAAVTAFRRPRSSPTRSSSSPRRLSAPQRPSATRRKEVGVRIAEIFVNDQDKARTFHTEVPGLVVKTDAQYGESARWLTVVPPRTRTASSCCSRPPSSRSPNCRRAGGLKAVRRSHSSPTNATRRRRAECEGCRLRR